jgi:protein-disulfide isomerase
MRLFLCLILACGIPVAFAQPPAVEPPPGVDFSALTAAQKVKALAILNEEGCTCLCGMKLAECRVKDPNCAYSKALSGMVVKGVHEGRTREEIVKSLADSKIARKAPKLLEDPVEIPIAGAPVQGPETARITVVEFSDFECPYCSRAIVDVKAIMDAYPKDVKLVYKQFPLSMHAHARLAAAASLAAQAQGKFWPMHDKLFAHYRELSRENILAWAVELGLDAKKLAADLDSNRFNPAIEKDLADGEAAGVEGTPAFFINGRLYRGPFTLATIKPILADELKGKPAAAGTR